MWITYGGPNQQSYEPHSLAPSCRSNVREVDICVPWEKFEEDMDPMQHLARAGNDALLWVRAEV